MSLVNNASLNNTIGSEDNSNKVPVVDSVKESDKANFIGLLKKEEINEESKKNNKNEEEDLMSPQELEQMIRESLFKRGFDRALERAREIVKEMKS